MLPNLTAITKKTGLQELQGLQHTQTRMDAGFVPAVTPVTRVTPNIEVFPETSGNENVSDLVREFMEVDGLSLEEAQALAAVSIQPRPAAEWLALIAELDVLIARYCAAAKLTDESKTHILTVRHRQSLATIPETLAWFRRELRNLDGEGRDPA